MTAVTGTHPRRSRTPMTTQAITAAGPALATVRTEQQRIDTNRF